MENTQYDTDFYTWTQQQAALLRSGKFGQADIANIVEEIESMGRSERRELESRMAVLMAHFLKWQFQPQRRGRSWQLTIEEQRIRLLDIVADNPGLKAQTPELMAVAYKLAVIGAMKESPLDKSAFPDSCPWSLAQLLDDGFYPG